MKTIVRIAFAAAIAVAFAGSAQAQRQRPGTQPGQPGQPGMQPGGGFGQGGGSLRSMLHTSKPLQEELKLTDDQIAKFKEYSEKNAAQRGQGGMGGFGGGGGGFGGGGFGGGGFGGGSDLDTLESLKAQMKTVEERIEFVNKTLTKEQAERFAQLETQRLGIRAFTNTRIAKELKLTEDQKKRIAEINKDLGEEMAKTFGQRGQQQDQAARDEASKKRSQLTEFAMEAIEKELTGEQKSNWTKMVGTKFDMNKLREARPTTN
jgi:hypothetical protein